MEQQRISEGVKRGPKWEYPTNPILWGAIALEISGYDNLLLFHERVDHDLSLSVWEIFHERRHSAMFRQVKDSVMACGNIKRIAKEITHNLKGLSTEQSFWKKA